MKKKTFIAVALLAAGNVAVFGQSKLSPYSMQMLHRAADAKLYGLAKTSTDTVAAYIHLAPGASLDDLEKCGLKIGHDFDGIVTARIPLNRISEVQRLESVVYISFAQPVYPQLDKAREAAQADKVMSGEGLPKAFTGKGVVVGIIDAGFDYTHPAFAASDGTTRIKRVWEQNTTSGTPPEGYDYGSEFASAESIAQAEGDITTNSHGTHVAAIAAGADHNDNNPYYGTAGESDIIMVSKGDLTQNNVNISDAVAYIFDNAEKNGQPCVINMSLGTNIGPHDGTSTFDQITDKLQGEGRLLVGSVGNFGASKVHIAGNFDSQEAKPIQTMLNFKRRPSASDTGGEIDIWGEKGTKYALQLVVCSQTSGQIVDRSDVMEVSEATAGNTFKYVVKKSGAGSVVVTTEINPFNGKAHAYVSSQLTSLRMNYTLGIIISPLDAGRVDAWADGNVAVFDNFGLECWNDGDTSHSLAEIGGTGKNIISVGAFTSRDVYTTEGSKEEKPTGEKLGERASFSSQGPSLDGRTKPEVMAPGTYIASAISSHDATASSLPIARSETVNGKKYQYAFMQGTSMAAPFVTGVLATWLEAAPDMPPAYVREILKQTSTLPDGGTEQTWGYGKINAYEGLKLVLKNSTGIANIGTDNSPFTVKVDGSECRILFATYIDNTRAELVDMTGRVISSQTVNGKKPGDEIIINTSNLPKGTYIIRLANRSWKLGI